MYITNIMDSTDSTDSSTLPAEYYSETQNAFITYFLKEKEIGKALKTVLDEIIIGQNYEIYARYAIEGFIKACLSKKIKLQKIASQIKEIITDKKYQKEQLLIRHIIDEFMDFCLLRSEKGIQEVASAVKEIITVKCIKENPKLLFKTINEFKNICFSRNEKILDIVSAYKCILDKKIRKEDIVKPIFINVMSEYLSDVLFHNKEHDGKTKKALLETYNKIFSKKHKNLENIPLLELSNLNNTYLKNRFDIEGIDGGHEYELFLKTICELFNPEYSKEIKLSEILKEENKKIFKNFKTIILERGYYNKENFLKRIGLKKEDFGKNANNDDFTIIHCGYLGHAFLVAVDRRESFKNAKIKLVDSSRAIKNLYKYQLGLSYRWSSDQSSSELLDGECINFLSNSQFLNKNSYQANGTCWIDAMAAFSVLLQKQKKAMNEGKNFSMDDIEKGFTAYMGRKLSELESEIIVEASLFYGLMQQQDRREQTESGKHIFVDNDDENSYYSDSNPPTPKTSIGLEATELEALQPLKNKVLLQEPAYKEKLVVEKKLLKEAVKSLSVNEEKLKEYIKRIETLEKQLDNGSKKMPVKKTATEISNVKKLELKKSKTGEKKNSNRDDFSF